MRGVGWHCQVGINRSNSLYYYGSRHATLLMPISRARQVVDNLSFGFKRQQLRRCELPGSHRSTKYGDVHKFAIAPQCRILVVAAAALGLAFAVLANW